MSRAPAAPPELPGFEFVRNLGSGGFSDVFLYDQKLPERRVAVKVLVTEGLTDASRAAFVAEANLMAKLAHPYIVSIYQAGVSGDGRPYLVMEYCSGKNLSDRYKAQPLGVVEALRTGIRLSSAIATAHQAGILHRDIKPANVLTNDFGWPALTDFGISSAIEDELPAMTTARELSDSGATTGSQSVGMSIPWSPPEMFEDDPKPTQRSDVFAMAATIYTLLAGRSPFEVEGRGNGSLELMSRIERGAITPLSRSDVPGTLLAVLRRGMATDPDNRYQSALDFARALQGVELQLGFAPTPIEVPNLTVPEPDLPSDPESADSTRIRQVTTIAAQPAHPTSPVGPEPTVLRGPRTISPVANSSTPPDSTMLRPRVTAAEPAAPGRVEPPKRGRVGLIAGVAAAAVLAIVATIVVVNMLDAPPVDSAGDTPPSSGEALKPPDYPPTPLAVGAPAIAADGTSVVFTWENPSPEATDEFVWQRTDGSHAADGRFETNESSTVVADVPPGTVVCIAVWVARDGELSVEPLELCSA